MQIEERKGWNSSGCSESLSHLLEHLSRASGSLVAQMVRNLLAMQETWVWSLSQEDPLEDGLAAHSNILAQRIPWNGAWRATVHGIANSQGTAEQLSTHAWSLVAADPVCLMIRPDYERPNFWLAELDNMHFLVDCWDTFITWCFMSGFSLWQGFRKQDRSRFLTKIIIIFWFHSFADSQCQNTNG